MANIDWENIEASVGGVTLADDFVTSPNVLAIGGMRIGSGVDVFGQFQHVTDGVLLNQQLETWTRQDHGAQTDNEDVHTLLIVGAQGNLFADDRYEVDISSDVAALGDPVSLVLKRVIGGVPTTLFSDAAFVPANGLFNFTRYRVQKAEDTTAGATRVRVQQSSDGIAFDTIVDFSDTDASRINTPGFARLGNVIDGGSGTSVELLRSFFDNAQVSELVI